MNSIRSRFFAACLMGLYGLIGTPIASVIFVAVAQCSDEHEVQVHGMEGGIRVVLHHRNADLTPRPHDHKEGVAKALTCLCGLNPEGDHVFVAAAPSASLSQSSIRSHLLETASAVAAVQARPSMVGWDRVVCDVFKVRLTQNATQWRTNKPQASMGTIALLV